jgi:putative membrane protein
MDLVILIIGILLGALFSGFIIWAVGRMGLGMEVSGFGPAYLAAIVIAVLNGLVAWLAGSFMAVGGLWGAIINLVVAAVFLMAAGRLIQGIRVKGFTGALVASVAIAVVGWLIVWAIGLFI